MLPAGAQAVPSDVVTIEDGFYGPSSLTIEEGSETGPAIAVGHAGIAGVAFDLYFTEPGTSIIRDRLFGLGGSFPGDGDIIYFSSDGMADPVLGTPCGAGMTCIEETGGVQDVTALLPECVFFGGCTITVQSDVVEAPLPATVALVGLGLLSAARLGRRRYRRR